MSRAVVYPKTYATVERVGGRAIALAGMPTVFMTDWITVRTDPARNPLGLPGRLDLPIAAKSGKGSSSALAPGVGVKVYRRAGRLRFRLVGS